MCINVGNKKISLFGTPGTEKVAVPFTNLHGGSFKGNKIDAITKDKIRPIDTNRIVNILEDKILPSMYCFLDNRINMKRIAPVLRSQAKLSPATKQDINGNTTIQKAPLPVPNAEMYDIYALYCPEK
ncbi:hypothetical protein B9L19_01935 [Geobacillus thermocatenulatus]|uniref:Uncharacterized protein n=1 Tax=Geobacillus thermocatenulatus TaxID=33938 RepID=A0A226QB60_9BACL|nr:hypothetical protein GT3921_10020 [Geobacillus thermocatenulatus]OXB88887.1 hypothetical protein B9L19_01935 [Geobacillus thermocatenulatus]